jgi:hypothetical protein
MRRQSLLILLAHVALVFPGAVSAQTMSFDAVVPTFSQAWQFGNCSYKESTYQTIASVAMTPSEVTLTLRLPSRLLERYFENPSCPPTRSQPQTTLTYTLARHFNNVNVQYSIETQRNGVGGVFGGTSGHEHVLYQVYFCAEDGARTCTWSRAVTNRILVSLYYRYYAEGQALYGFSGQYLGPNPGTLSVPTITSLPVLLPGFVGEPYGPFGFDATGGTPPYTWRAVTGPPAFLDVSPAGIITGVPEIVGDHSLTVELRDAAGLTTSKTFVVPIAATRPITFTTPRLLPPANVGDPYRQEICVEGGRPDYRFSGSTITQGLTIGGIGKGCGAISGTPRTPNLQIHPDLEAFATPWPVYVTVVDSAGNKASAVFMLNVTDFPPFTQPKSPRRKAELAVSGLTKLGLAAIAGYLTVTGCPVFGPAAPACVSFMGGIGISQLIPGAFEVKAAFDPPDNAFRSIVAVAPKPLKPVPPGQLPGGIAAALERVVANQAEQAGLADAYRRSNDKAAGAFFAGDTCWTRAQLHAAETFAQRKADSVALERPLRAALRAQLAGLPTFTVTPDQLQHLQQDIIVNGDDSEYIQALKQGTGGDDGASVMLRHMLQSAILDLRSSSGVYGLDLANTARDAATEEEEAAWRGLGEQRDWANFACDREGLTVRVNQATYVPGQTLTTEATLFPPSASGSLVDAYIVLSLPTGEFLSLQQNGGVVSGIAAFAQGIPPLAFDRHVLHYVFNGSEPRGSYQWLSVLTQPGTLNFVSPLRTTTFTLN